MRSFRRPHKITLKGLKMTSLAVIEDVINCRFYIGVRDIEGRLTGSYIIDCNGDYDKFIAKKQAVYQACLDVQRLNLKQWEIDGHLEQAVMAPVEHRHVAY